MYLKKGKNILEICTKDKVISKHWMLGTQTNQ